MMDDAGTGTEGQRLVYFAAERTLLSWIRTALGLMALGFVLDRFDVFMQRASGIAGSPRTWTGAPVMFAGAIMAAVAAGRYLAFARRYRRSGDTEPGRGIVVGALFAIVVALLGVVIACLLLPIGG